MSPAAAPTATTWYVPTYSLVTFVVGVRSYAAGGSSDRNYVVFYTPSYSRSSSACYVARCRAVHAS